MSVKHLEYLKTSDSKILVVEVRPVKCLVETSSGPTYTDKWMEFSHWKELEQLMTDIVEEYEQLKTTQGVKLNQPKCKTGETIQIGYMFRNLSSCFCSLYFLTPRGPSSWTKSHDGRLQDKGGRFEDFPQCGEMLVISIILQDSAPSSTTEVTSTPSSSGTFQQACLNQKLIKALDSSATFVNSISNYFKPCTASVDDVPAKHVPSSNKEQQKSSPVMVRTLTRFHEKHESRKDENSEFSFFLDDSDCDSNSEASTSNSVEELNYETEEKEMNLPSVIFEHARVGGTKSFENYSECTENNFTVFTCKDGNTETTSERPTEHAYQCYDVNSDEKHSSVVSFTNESQEMFSDFEIPVYQYETLNNCNVSYNVSADKFNSQRDNSQLDVSLSPHADRSTARGTVPVDDNASLHSMSDVRSLEVSESIVNENELQKEIEEQRDTFPCRILDYSPETNTFNSKNLKRKSSSPESGYARPPKNWWVNAENPIDNVQMSENSPVFIESEDYLPEGKVQIEATKDVSSTTPVNDVYTGNVNILEEDLHGCSYPTVKYVGQEMPNSGNALQECLPSGMLFKPLTKEAVKKEQCETFETPEAKCKHETQNVRKKKKVQEKSTIMSRISRHKDEDERLIESSSSMYTVPGKNKTREAILPTVKEKPSRSKNDLFKHKVLQSNSASSSSCENPWAPAVYAAGAVDKENIDQNGLENHNISCLNDVETSELYVDKPEIKLESQDKADEEYVPLEIFHKWKKKKSKKDVEETEVKLEFEDDTSHRADEYDPQANTHRWKKSKREMLNPVLNYIPTSIRNLSPINAVKEEVQEDLACSIRAPEPLRYTDEVKLEHQNHAPCRAYEENEFENIAHNGGKKEMSVPTNEGHLATDHVSFSNEDSEVQKNEMAYDTTISEGLSLCVEQSDCMPKRKQQQIQATKTCESLFTHEEERVAEDRFEDLDSLFISKKKYDNQKIPVKMEMPEEYVPSVRLESLLYGKSNNESDYAQSSQSCVQFTEPDQESLKTCTIFDDQEVALEGKETNVPSEEPVQLSISNDGSESYMKRSLRKKAYLNTNSYTNQKEKRRKKHITSHIPTSATAVENSSSADENMINDHSLKDNSFNSTSSEDSDPKQVDDYEENVLPDLLGYELDNSSLQSSSYGSVWQDKAPIALHESIQSVESKKSHPGGSESEAELENLPTFTITKRLGLRGIRKVSREEQIFEDSNNPRMKPTDSTAPEEFMSVGAMSQKRKAKSAPKHEECISSPKKKKTIGNSASQEEELYQRDQDAAVKYLSGESSQNCAQGKICKSRLLDENVSECLHAEKDESTSFPRRSTRPKKKEKLFRGF